MKAASKRLAVQRALVVRLRQRFLFELLVLERLEVRDGVRPSRVQDVSMRTVLDRARARHREEEP